MKTQPLSQKLVDAKLMVAPKEMTIGSAYIAIVDGVTYPIARSSEKEAIHLLNAANTPPNLFPLNTKVELWRISRRIKAGDRVRIKRIALRDFEKQFDLCCNQGDDKQIKIYATVTEVFNNGRFEVAMEKDSNHIMKLYRKDVEIQNVSDTHVVAHLICQHCKSVL